MTAVATAKRRSAAPVAPAARQRHAQPAPRASFTLPREPDPSWRDWAACRWDRLKAAGLSLDVFSTSSKSAVRTPEEDRAVAYCRASCPVIRECFLAAWHARDDEGVSGGTTGRERRSLRRRLAEKRRAAASSARGTS